jgi:protein O-GlcNAc transferase
VNSHAVSTCDHARALLAAGDIAGAQSACAPLVAGSDAREAARAHLILSACAQRSDDPAAAQAHVRAALQRNPDESLAHYALAEIQERAGDSAAAIESLERAIALQDTFTAAHQRLGILLGEAGATERAAAAFERVTALDPNNARGFNNLGNALRSLGRMDEARTSFERAVELRPDYDLAIANVAVTWRDAGEVERAERLLRAALSRSGGKPPLRAMIVMMAGLLRERGEFDQAEPLYHQAIAMAPQASAGEWFNLGRVLAEREESDHARDAYARSFAADPTDLRGALASRLALPMIYANGDDLAAAREAYANGLERLHDDVEHLVNRLTVDQLLDGLRWTNFFLAYQGRDDRALQTSYGSFVARALELRAPQWRVAPEPRRPRDERLRVGFASAFFHVGTAGRYFRSWLTELDPERFELCVYHLCPGMDEIAEEIRARADRFVEFGGSRARPSVVAPAIRKDELDVLVYPELGMDHTSFALAALRLAPRQLAGWGHPVTSGHGTIDGFISCAEMEPADGHLHYAEPLLTLPGIGTCYRRLALPIDASRSRFNLPEKRPLLLCPQSLFKIHPDNDEIFASVLSANPDAVLVMFDGRHPRLTDRFMRRISGVFDRHAISIQRQLIVMPAVPHDDYLRINLVCDAMLDTMHWSGGNTSLDALACGLPIVTFEGQFMRGRQSAAMLRQAGVPELVAHDRDEYVRIASRLLQDSACRHDLAARIRRGGERLFDTPAPVDAFAKVLLASV